MKQYICQGCPARCAASAPDRPSQCLFEKDSKCPKWELVEQPVRNNYATVNREETTEDNKQWIPKQDIARQAQ